MRVTAVVVTHNSAKGLAACMHSLKSSGIDDAVIVDTESADESCAVARSLGASVVYNIKNRGFGAACNYGAAKITTDHILFINPDATLTPDALTCAMTQFAGTVGAVGLLLTSVDGTTEPQAFGADVTLWSMLARHLSKPAVLLEPKVVAWVSGGALLVQNKAFKQIKGFDEDFFMYWEDVDLCKRLRLAGWKIVITPQARVIHGRGASSQNIIEKTRWYDESADRYFRKHYAKTICLIQYFLRRIYRYFSPVVQ